MSLLPTPNLFPFFPFTTYLPFTLSPFLPFFPSLRVSCPGRSGGGAGKGRRACNYVSGIVCSPSTGLLYFRQSARSGNERECNQNTWKLVLRVMTPLLMSSPPISILHRLFRCRYSNSRDVVASSPSFSLSTVREAQRAYSQATVFLARMLKMYILLHTL